MSDIRSTRLGSVVPSFNLFAVLVACSTLVGCAASDSVVGVLDDEPADLTITMAVAEQVTTPANLELAVGETATLAATAMNALGQPVGSAQVVWGSTDESVATVGASGEVLAVGAGSAQVFATAGGISAALPVQVTEPIQPPGVS